jgi:hypothetical protein
MTTGIPNLANIAEVDGFGQGFGNSVARRFAVVVIPFSYAALCDAMREGERWRAAARV